MGKRQTGNLQVAFPRKTPPYRVFFTWEITYNCNYRCTYCHAPKPGNPDTRKTTSLDAKKWIGIWDDVYKNYGACFILISGGEPFAYPSFMDLVTQLHKKHIIELCTNLEWDVKPFVKNMDPKRIKVATSLHPEFADLDRFLHRLKLLKDNGFRTHVNFVPWPPFLERMAEYKEKVEALGVQFILQPFIGDYEGRRYPQGYTESEREYFKIFKDSCNISTLDFKTTNESNKKGKLCRMGQNYAFIHPDGAADRCCKDHSVALGNVIDKTFRLLEEPAACTIEECNCWRCMLVEKEPEWVNHWGWAEIEDIEPVAIKSEPSGARQGEVLDGRDSGARVALVQLPPWGVFDPPNALAQMSSYIKRDGHKAAVFDVNVGLYNSKREQYKTVWAIEQSGFWHNQENVLKFFNDNSETINDFIQRIIAVEPEVVGLSVSSASLHFAMEFVKKIKEKRPQVKIVFGGAMFFVQVDMESILNNGCVDIIILGEGEESFSELLQILRDGRDLGLCRGICFKKGGKIVNTGPREYMKNLDELPFLDFSDLPLDRYDPPGHLGRHISLMTSRGCIQNCVFCGPKAYWQGFRTMSGKRIYDEIRYHIALNPDIEHIEFLDLLFNGSIKTLNDFCDLMISDPPKPGLKWHVNAIIRPEMTLEVFQKMKRAGCHHITYGIESGSQRVLGLMKKRYKVKDADDVLENNHKAGIEVTCNFMFGFPGETEEDFQETLDFLRRNSRYITTAYPSRTYCTVEPFSYMEKQMEEFDMVPNKDYPIYWESRDSRNNYPERLRRCEVFSSLALSLDVAVGSGLQTSVELDKWFSLGFYYLAKKDSGSAKRSFQNYLKLDPKNEVINNKIHELDNALNADRP
ncbi:MAG: radical SAM protein, partial [Candidatus Omnitrophica bacterium]|nr:radical SAM protein [Candidatus Omnitrophota bacterium]